MDWCYSYLPNRGDHIETPSGKRRKKEGGEGSSVGDMNNISS
jgi:hypothetical protein